MSNVIARPFSITRDFRSIMWGATLQYNVLRAACAGLVVAIIMLIAIIKSAPGQGPQVPIPMLLLLPIFWPLAFFFVFFPVSLVLAWLSEMLPILAFVAICYALMFVTIGDPIVCILRKFAPKLVPVERPSFFSLRPVYWVLKPEETSEFSISH
ncbi:MAG TPA: hypothetical protein VHD56_02650 [Tepidisphaeraceae bacterium]|nr:hypothetical protein [Tepidisphaeraceae bacterium]